MINHKAGHTFKISIPPRSSDIPVVHPHPSVGSIRWGSKVGVVSSTTVLSHGDHSITSLTAFSKVGFLEVSGELVEPESVGKIVEHVDRVEKVGNREVDVLSSTHSKLVTVN